MAQTVSTGAPARATHDFYYAVHKGLRRAHGRLLDRIATCDTADRDALAGLAADIRHHLAMYRSHLEHENDHFHTALEARVPGATLTAAHEHDGHERGFAELLGLADALVTADAEGAPAALRALYRAYCLFMAHDHLHMDGEENVLMPILQAYFSDAELAGIEAGMVADIPPEQATWFMRMMLGAATPAERRGLLAEWQAAMPPEVFTGNINAVVGGEWRAGDIAAFDLV